MKEKTNVDITFEEKFNELIESNGFTQNEAAKGIGITRQAVSLYTTGQRTPDINTLYKICDFFKVSADYFIGITDQKTSNIDDKAIHEAIGLSDKAIEKLKRYKKYLPGVLIPLLSELIECEAEPDALSLLVKYKTVTTITDEEYQVILEHYEDEAEAYPYPEYEDDKFVYVPEFWEGPLLHIAEYFESVIYDAGELYISTDRNYIGNIDAQNIIDTVIFDKIKDVLYFARSQYERSKVNAEIRFEKYTNTLE